MRFIITTVLLFLFIQLNAQRECVTFEYRQQIISEASLAESIMLAEAFLQKKKNVEILSNRSGAAPAQPLIIKIPVVVHVLYNKPEENISYQRILSQIEILNKDFRNKNTQNSTGLYSNLAADAGIEFQLATIDPLGNPTTGIVRTKTDIRFFNYDDRIKFSNQGGSNAWDAGSYLNIWVGNLAGGLAGYSSPVGSSADKDGVVIRYNYFGKTGTGNYGFGRTATHEIGHWLGLNHIWGDAPCGDDGVADTPPQQTSTNGCPNGIVQSCNNEGNMYMNFMDYTNDQCVYMFTNGQAERMRKLFEPGGFRHSLLQSEALSGSVMIEENIITEAINPAKVFPNPAINELNINFGNDKSIFGQSVIIYNTLGQPVYQTVVKSSVLWVDISKFKPGAYYIIPGRRKPLKFLKK